MVRVAGPDSHGFSYSRLGFCMFVFGFWAAWAYRIESFVDSVAISPCKFCVWPDFHGLRPSIPIAWLRATYTRAIWYSIAGPQTIVKLFAGCWKCPPHTFHVPDFSIYLGFPTSNQSFHLHYLNLRFDTILHTYIYIYQHPPMACQLKAVWPGRQWGAVLFIDDMNLEYDDVIPGSLECSEGHRQVLHMPPQPVTAGSGMWSGSFGVSNKGFQHTSMFKHGIIVIPKMLRMFFNVIVLKGLAFARVWSHAEHTNETPNKEPWHDIWHGLGDVCCFILTLWLYGVSPAHLLDLRALVEQMVAKMPQGKSNEDDLVCGGDLRARGNRWLRSAFVSSKLTKVPRENQIRMAVKKLMAKRKMGTMVVKGVFSSCLFKVFGVPPSLIVLCGWVYVEIIQGKILSRGARQDWVRQQDSWFKQHTCEQVTVKITQHLPHHVDMESEAFKCHDILLKHARAKRRGFAYRSPTDSQSKGILVQI